MNWRLGRECADIESEDERTLIVTILGDLVSGAQGTTVGHTVNLAEMVVGVEG
jgi:hypothetical protein